MAEKAILYDATKCTACRGCQAACKQWNENSEFIPDIENGVPVANRGSYENPPDLSPTTWLKIEFREQETGGKLRWLFNRRACMHCTEASCINVCPNGSVFRNEMGFVSFNKDTCTGCGYCKDFCPFDVPRLNRGVLGAAKMDKCTLCTSPGLDRIGAGQEPACVKTCPTDALVFGDRERLVIEGKKRVESLQYKGYQNAYFYGDIELGGLHVMYVLEESPQAYGLPVSPTVPLAATAWQDVLKPVGWLAGGLTVAGLALNYMIARKAKIAGEITARKEE
ncbi:MAG: 4Fe-4S dicluster domain-containing protein [Dehalococcoidales bacterium]|nr:4Fe-4S dicluster domain-containing protein [Dehalococcoidales bacterium]